MRLRALLTLCCLTLAGAHAMANPYQPVTRLTCLGGEFAVDARPWGENEAGSSQVELRYRYRGVALAAIHYEAYYKNLDPWLRQGSPRIYNLGLNLDTSGGSRRSGYDQGDTLYLPPSAFTQAEVEDLFDCLGQQHAALRRDFERAQINSSAFLGLMKTRTGTGRNGVARLVHADAPITGIYGSGWLLILVERGGRVVLHTNATANNPAESMAWGEAAPGANGGRPLLRAQREVRLYGQVRDAALFLPEPEKSTGRRLQEDFRVEWR